jgi:hypothetical protein
MAKKGTGRKGAVKPSDAGSVGGRFHDDKDKNDLEWYQILESIEGTQCVPFLGAGACYPHLPLAASLAEQLAAKLSDYPFDRRDLSRVSQHAALTLSPPSVKRDVATTIKAVVRPDQQPGGAAPDEPHRVLARLPLPLYMTTNYDLFMLSALQALPDRKPYHELCRWNDLLNRPGVFTTEPNFKLHPATPVVFHLHGHVLEPLSLVLTEDDYLWFLEEMIRRRRELLPGPVADLVRSASILFIGYSLADWNFRLLLRSLGDYAVAQNYVVLKPPSGEGAKKMQDYLTSYYQALKLRVFWGTAQEFCGELTTRWATRTAGR